jgi:zinc transport system substrate-binding protein
MTTFIPITDFTKAVAGDRAQVTQLLPTNVEPHDYQAKPGDAQKLAKADVLVQNGLGIEGYLTELVKNTGNAKLKVIDSSQGIQPIATETIEGKQPKSGQNRPPPFQGGLRGIHTNFDIQNQYLLSPNKFG